MSNKTEVPELAPISLDAFLEILSRQLLIRYFVAVNDYDNAFLRAEVLSAPGILIGNSSLIRVVITVHVGRGSTVPMLPQIDFRNGTVNDLQKHLAQILVEWRLRGSLNSEMRHWHEWLSQKPFVGLVKFRDGRSHRTIEADHPFSQFFHLAIIERIASLGRGLETLASTEADVRLKIDALKHLERRFSPFAGDQWKKLVENTLGKTIEYAQS